MDRSNDLFSNICRICLSVNNKRTVPLFESNGTTSCYGQAIVLCTKEELPHLEYAPNNMCYSCLRQLRQCILFQKQCKNSQNYFEQISLDTHLLSNMKENLMKQLYNNNIMINDDKNDNSGINNDTKIYFSDNDTNDLFNDIFDIEEEVTDTRAMSKNHTLILQNNSKINDNILNVIENIIKEEVKYAKKHNHSESSNDVTITKNKRKHCRKKFRNKTFEKSDVLSQITETRLHRPTSHSSEATFNNELSQINKQNNKINPEVTNLENKTLIIEINSNKPVDIKEENKIDIFNLIREIENKNFTLKHLNGTNNSSESRKHKNKVKHRINTKPMKKVIKAQKMICDSCNKVFANRNTLLKHLERHAGVTSFVCELCGKGFITKAELGVHLVLSHDTGRHYPCDQCGYKAPRLFDLKEHRRVHTGERPFACDKCGLTFRRQYVWQQHQIYHTEKTLQCQKCPLKFHKISALRSHENCVHERKYVYNCPICGTTYAQNKSVRRHLLETHGVARERQGKIERVLVNNIINEIPT